MKNRFFSLPSQEEQERLDRNAGTLAPYILTLGACLYMAFALITVVTQQVATDARAQVLLAANGFAVVLMGLLAAGIRHHRLLMNHASACIALGLLVALVNTLLRITWFETPPVGILAYLILCSLLLLRPGWYLLTAASAVVASAVLVAASVMAADEFVTFVVVGGLLSLFMFWVRLNNSVHRVRDQLQFEQMAREIDEREKQTAQLLEIAPFGTLVHEGGKIVWANQQAAQLLGEASVEDLLGASPYRWLAETHRDGVAQRLALFEDTASTRGAEIFKVGRGDEQVLLESSATPVTFRGVPSRTVFLRDVTAEYQQVSSLDDARREAEAESEARSRFLATMSHELRTPLNAIVGLSDVLRQATEGSGVEDEHRQYLELIHSNGRYMESLIADLLDIGTVDSGRLELLIQPVQVSRLLDEIADSVKPLLTGKNLRISTSVDGGLMVRMDENRMRQVLFNLVANAVRYSPESGTIDLRASPGEAGTADILVTDTGEGVPDDEKELIFSEFYASRSSGRTNGRSDGTSSGIGLSVCRRIIEYHGGSIVVENHQPSGARFRISLPAVLVAQSA